MDILVTCLTAIGLVFLVEGLVYALAPQLLDDLLAALSRLSTDQRRLVGLLAISLGAIFLLVARTLGG